VIGADEAGRIAREWATALHPDSVVTLTEFGRGFVARRTAPEVEGLAFDVPVRIVVDGQTGAVVDFPALPEHVVADLYEQRCRAAERFSAQTLALLELAGWRAGRDVGLFVDRWWAAQTTEDLPIPVRTALAEFAGIVLPMARLSLLPFRGDEPVERSDGRIHIGQMGADRLALDDSGAVYRNAERLADSIDEALPRLLG